MRETGRVFCRPTGRFVTPERRSGALNDTLQRALESRGATPPPLAPANGWEYVLLSPLRRGVWGFSCQCLRHRGLSTACLQVLLPRGLAFPELSAERADEHSRKQRATVLFALPLLHRDLLVLKIQVFHSQSKRLGETETSPVEEVGDQAVRPLHLTQKLFHFLLSSNDREPLRLFGPVKVGDGFPFSTKHVAVEEQKGIEGLVLRGGGDVSLRGEVGQVVSNVFFPKLTRMLGPVILDVADDPTKVRLFSPVGIALSATGRPDAIYK